VTEEKLDHPSRPGALHARANRLCWFPQLPGGATGSAPLRSDQAVAAH